MSPAAHTHGYTTPVSRIDRLALRIAKRSPTPAPASPPDVSDDGQLS